MPYVAGEGWLGHARKILPGLTRVVGSAWISSLLAVGPSYGPWRNKEHGQEVDRGLGCRFAEGTG